MDTEDKDSSSDETTEKSVSLDVYDSSDEDTEGEMKLLLQPSLQNVL